MPPALWDSSLVPEPQPRHGTFTQMRWEGLGAAVKPCRRLSWCHLCAHTDISAAVQDADGSSSTASVPPSCLGLGSHAACPTLWGCFRPLFAKTPSLSLSLSSSPSGAESHGCSRPGEGAVPLGKPLNPHFSSCFALQLSF